MAKYAIFGDSYVSRLNNYTNGRLDFKHDHRFFGVPGMTTQRKFNDMFDRLLQFKPTFVFLNLGENDFSASCDPHATYIRIINIVETLYKSGVERVFVASIIERGRFPKWTNLDHKLFNEYRRHVNRKLKQYFQKDFVQIGKRLIFPRHYDTDLVHPGFKEGGMNIYKHEVQKAFCKTL